MKCILIASVGGQGGLALSRIIALTAKKLGEKVIVGETLGMSQRGGSVHVYIRIGKGAYSPLLMPEEASLTLGLEPLETVRALKYISRRGIVVLNVEPIPPISSILGSTRYPSIADIITLIGEHCRKIYTVNSSEKCRKLGFSRGMNVHLLGVAVGLTGFLEPNAVKASIVELLPQPENNLRVFDDGLETGRTLKENR